MKYGFDNDKYVKIQSEKIEERINMFDKLYLEFGGKIFDDFHAARVLPGFEPNAKIKLASLFSVFINIEAQQETKCVLLALIYHI